MGVERGPKNSQILIYKSNLNSSWTFIVLLLLISFTRDKENKIDKNLFVDIKNRRRSNPLNNKHQIGTCPFNFSLFHHFLRLRQRRNYRKFSFKTQTNKLGRQKQGTVWSRGTVSVKNIVKGHNYRKTLFKIWS